MKAYTIGSKSHRERLANRRRDSRSHCSGRGPGDTWDVPGEDIFAEMEPYMVQVALFDGSRESSILPGG